MKISYSWLNDHIALEIPAKDLAAHLEQLGIEVASLARLGPAFSGVVAAEILEIAKHPNADRLSLCTVSDGASKLSIVCGAKNIAVGQKVPLARIGAKLPGGREITPAKIRGVESQGMICSSTELGLGTDGDGILVLAPGTRPGADVAQALGPADDVLDLEVTPNRPDLLSHRGLARELAAYFRLPIKTRSAPALPVSRGDCAPVEIEAAAACPRYLGRVFSGLEIGPSPAWLSARLEAVGLRAINNLVDVTNYVLMDTGQPLHAFDLDKIDGGRLAVRFAKAGERFSALDGKDYPLTPECLVIADAKKPLAAAGVMGGQDSGVTAKTKRAFLETAYFAAPVVRKTSQSLRLRSDSSYRFERGADLMAVPAASEAAAGLILSLCGKSASASAPLDLGKKSVAPTPIAVTARRVNEILGSAFPEDAVAATLKSISANLSVSGADLSFTPPSYRRDLQTPWDLAEETARLLGYDNIRPRLSAIPLKAPKPLPSQSIAERCRRRLASLGLLEAYNYDFLSEKRLKLCRFETAGLPRLANPLSEDWAILRPTLLAGLLQNAAANVNRGAASVRLFELGKVYALAAGGVEERSRVAGLLLGPVADSFWKPERCPDSDFYDAKGLVADLLSGVPGLRWLPFGDPEAGRTPSDPIFHSASALRLTTPRGPLGTVGLLHPQLARAEELDRQLVTVFDLDLDLLGELEPSKSRFAPFGRLPSSKRDLSIVVDSSSPYADVEAAALGCRIAELKALELVDVFAGKGIPDGKHSLTLRLTFASDDRTLKDAEVNAAVEKILAALKARLGAQLRG